MRRYGFPIAAVAAAALALDARADCRRHARGRLDARADCRRHARGDLDARADCHRHA